MAGKKRAIQKLMFHEILPYLMFIALLLTIIKKKR